MAQTVGEICCTISADFSPRPLVKGDRVDIREGFEGAGTIGIYLYKSNDDPGMVIVLIDGAENVLLADSIVAKPYTREERILRAIEDYHQATEDMDGQRYGMMSDQRALLFAILDAGV